MAGAGHSAEDLLGSAAYHAPLVGAVHVELAEPFGGAAMGEAGRVLAMLDDRGLGEARELGVGGRAHRIVDLRSIPA